MNCAISYSSESIKNFILHSPDTQRLINDKLNYTISEIKSIVTISVRSSVASEDIISFGGIKLFYDDSLDLNVNVSGLNHKKQPCEYNEKKLIQQISVQQIEIDTLKLKFEKLITFAGYLLEEQCEYLQRLSDFMISSSSPIKGINFKNENPTNDDFSSLINHIIQENLVEGLKSLLKESEHVINITHKKNQENTACGLHFGNIEIIIIQETEQQKLLKKEAIYYKLLLIYLKTVLKEEINTDYNATIKKYFKICEKGLPSCYYTDFVSIIGYQNDAMLFECIYEDFKGSKIVGNFIKGQIIGKGKNYLSDGNYFCGDIIENCSEIGKIVDSSKRIRIDSNFIIDETELLDTANRIYKLISLQEESQVNNNYYVKSLAYFYYFVNQTIKITTNSNFSKLLKYIHRKLNKMHLAKKELFKMINILMERKSRKKVLNLDPKDYKPIENLNKDFCNKFVKTYLNLSTQEFSSLHKLKRDLKNDSRYLMIIIKKNLSTFIIESILKEYNKDFKLLTKEGFKENNSHQEETFTYLSSIIRDAEAGTSLIFYEIDFIYSSLDDLFNQKFSAEGENEYCQILLKDSLYKKFLVHKNFKVVVIINDDDTINKVDSQLFNLFEKHYIGINDILGDEKYKTISDDLNNWIKRIFNISITSPVNVTSVIPTLSNDTIYFMTQLTIEEMKNKQKKYEDIFPIIKSKIIEMSSFEIVLLCRENKLNKDEKKFIISEWNKKNNITLEERLKSVKYNDNKNLIVMTYDKSLISDKLSENLGKSLKIVQLKMINSDQEFNKILTSFVDSVIENIMLLELDYSKEYSSLYNLLNIIESAISKSHQRKTCCFILRMRVNDKLRDPISYLKNWKCIFYDYLSEFNLNINEKYVSIDILNIRNILNFLNFRELVACTLIDAFSCINYGFLNYKMQYEINLHISKVCTILKNDPDLFTCLVDRTYRIISEDQNKSMNWTKSIFQNKLAVDEEENSKKCSSLFFREEILKYLALLIYSIESDLGFNFMKYTSDEIPIHLIKIIWKKKLEAKNIITHKIFTLREPTLLVHTQPDIITPFIIDERKLFDSFFERKLKQGLNINFDLENELNFYIERNSMILNIEEIRNSEEVLKIYMKDFLKALLKFNNLNGYLINIIIQILFSSNNILNNTKKIIFIKDHLKIIELLNKIYNSIDNLAFTEKISFEKIDNLVINSENEINEMLRNLLELSLEIILDSQHDKKIHEAYKKVLVEIKDQIIENNLKLKQNILKKLNFWIRFLDFCKEKVDILKLCEVIKDKEYFKNQVFQYFVHQIINSSETKTNEKYFQFYFYELIMEEQEYNFNIIVSKIESNDSWKFSNNLIKKILKISNLSETIIKFEMNQGKVDLFTSNDFKALARIDQNIYISKRNIFSVLLMNEIKKITLNVKTDKIIILFKRYLIILESKNLRFKELSQLIALSRIKCILDFLCEIIIKNDCTEEESSFIQEIIFVLNERNMKLFYLYIVKILKSKKKLSLSKIEKMMNRLGIKSSLDSEHKLPEDIEIFPYYDDETHDFEKLTEYLRNIEKNSELIIEMIEDDCKNSKKRFIILTAFLNEFYIKHREIDFKNEYTINWFRANKDRFRKAGNMFVELISRLIQNFPDNSPLYLKIEENSNEFIKKISICFYLCFVIAFSTDLNPFSSIVIDTNGFANLELLNSYYIIGIESNFLYQYHKFLQEKFESYQNKGDYNSGTQSESFVICSFECEFIYVISNCDGPIKVDICSNCFKNIGGISNKLCETDRGHRYITKEEAKRINNSVISRNQSNPEKGYLLNINSLETVNRELKNHLSNDILLLFCHSFLSYLFYSDFIDKDALKLLISYKGDQMEDDLNKKTDSLFCNLIRYFEENTYSQLLSIISELPNFIKDYPHPFSEFIDRDNFEKNFEDHFFNPHYMHEIKNSYKKKHSRKSYFRKIIEEKEIPEYEFASYFNILSDPSLINFNMNLIPKEKSLHILNFFLENKSGIESLRLLYPILEFSNYAVKKFSLTLSRRESEAKSIKEYIDSDEKLRTLFIKFKECWKILDLDLQICCHRIEKSKKIQITENTKLCYLLCDQYSFEVYQIFAAISTLIEIHNSVVSLVKSDKTSMLYLDNLKHDDIVSFPSDLENILSENSINHIEYGRGNEIIYNFYDLNETFKELIINKKFIDEFSIPFICYGFELHFIYSDLITEMRNRYQQENLNEDDELKIRKISKNILKSNTQDESEVNLFKYYHILDRLIIYLKNTEVNREWKINQIISQMIQFYVPLKADDYKICEEIGNLNIKYLNHIYEIIEEDVYYLKLDDISDLYKNKIPDSEFAQLQQFVKFIAKDFGENSIKEFSNGLKRFILRNMNFELACSHPIAKFILEAYFNMNMASNLNIIISKFPKEIFISHIVSCVTAIDNIINDNLE